MGNAVPRFRLALRGLVPVLGLCALVAGLSRVPVHAGSATNTFVIPANDGYGLGECLIGGRPCGRIVADAWCEAHGHRAARAFGRAEDITATISNTSASDAAAPGSIIVTCAD